MNRISENFSFKTLLVQAPRGKPLTTAWLARHGLSAKHAARLAHEGWLRRVGHGVYALPGDALDRDATLATLGELLPEFHVGGKTALGWRGIRHNLNAQETLSLWGEKPLRLPEWFATQFPAHYQSTHLFTVGLPNRLGMAPLPGGQPEVQVSTPERAILELLSDVGKRQTLEEAGHLIESARSLRLPVLDELMGHLKRIKVVRLACAVSHELDLPWKPIALKHSTRLGGGERWITVGRTGERLSLRKSP